MDSLINQIDHIMIQTEFPKEVFTILSQTLCLPIVWPIKSYGGVFISGGICLGNINIEILNYAKFLKIFRFAPKKHGIIGIAFQPGNSIEDTSKILDKIGVYHGEPKPFKSKQSGENKTIWTNLFLKKILPKSQIFFCKYSFDVAKRRNKFNDELKKENGGLIGVQSVKEIIIGYSDDEILNSWKKLSQKQYKYNDCHINFKIGPSINLIKSKENSILSILVKVNSVNKAKKILSKQPQVTLINDNEIIIKHKKDCYLGLKLCE